MQKNSGNVIDIGMPAVCLEIMYREFLPLLVIKSGIFYYIFDLFNRQFSSENTKRLTPQENFYGRSYFINLQTPVVAVISTVKSSTS